MDATQWRGVCLSFYEEKCARFDKKILENVLDNFNNLGKPYMILSVEALWSFWSWHVVTFLSDNLLMTFIVYWKIMTVVYPCMISAKTVNDSWILQY